MKTIILSAAVILLAVLLSISTSEPAKASEQKAGTTGTIQACWSLLCGTPPSGSATILLKSPDGSEVYGSCVLTVERTCCNITGDFPTGTYYFEYSMPASTAPCTSATFSYTNGTNVSQNLICNCP
jgi:hypothetical protein